MQKFKLLVEPKQETNSKKKKEKIKSTISQTELEANLLQNTRILESWKLGNCLQNLNCNIFPRSLE